MKNYFKVRLVLRKDKRRNDGKCAIYFYPNLNGREFKLSTGKWLEISNWDFKQRKPKSNCANLRRTLNRELMDIEDFYSDRIARNKTVTIEMVKSFYRGVDEQDFYPYYDKFLTLKKRTEKESTVKSYIGTLNHLKKFRRRILINEIDVNFIEAFDYYLRVKVNMGNGGAWARHKNLKTVINKLVKEKLLESNPYSKDEFYVPRPKSEPTFLDEYEIEKIAYLRDRLSPKMGVNIDRFLFACFTGFRYSDMVTLKWSDVKKNGTIRKRMIKTRNEVVVPISEGVQEILNRYEGKSNELVFPKISNDKVNKALRIICKLAKLNKHVTYHVGRHSFGYLLGKNSINAFKIMELMGHTNVKQTMVYVQADVKDLSSAIMSIELFKKAS
ncbi:MAG: site-specific integrase [Fluviicola sp.]|nr:site-specific integrase [Fluviicola sp.]